MTKLFTKPKITFYKKSFRTKTNLMNKQFLTLLTVLVLGITAVSAQSDVYFVFKHKVGYDSLVLGDRYTHPDGYDFTIDQARFYVCNMSIDHDGGSNSAFTDVYILAEAPTEQYQMGTATFTDLEEVNFSVGVDASKNHLDPTSYAPSHPLSPKSPTMHWGWTAGYKFVVLEGMVDTDNNGSLDRQYQMHVVGDEYFRDLSFEAAGTDVSGDIMVYTEVNYMNWLRDLNLQTVGIAHGGGPNIELLVNTPDNRVVFREVPSTTFSISVDSVFTQGLANAYDIYTPIYLTNNVGSDLALEWERIYEDLPTGWYVTSCDPESCKDSSFHNSSFTLGANGLATDYINVHFYPNNVVGVGTARTRVWDPATMDEFLLTFKAEATQPPTGIGNVSVNTGHMILSPVPADEHVNVQYAFTGQETIRFDVVDMLGKIVGTYENQPANGNLQIDLMGETSGLYVISARTADGSVILLQEKILKQ